MGPEAAKPIMNYAIQNCEMWFFLFLWMTCSGSESGEGAEVGNRIQMAVDMMERAL